MVKKEGFFVFAANPIFLISVVGFFSLLVGSFLNVSIHRTPIMIQRTWDEACKGYVHENDPGYTPEPQARFNLFVPRSYCPACNHQITAIENIPVISYLMLRGKCKGCKTSISKQYPIVELLTSGTSMFIAWKFGYGFPMLAMLVCAWTLITIGMIDVKIILPDFLMWLGLLVNLSGSFIDIHSAFLGAIIGYLSLLSIFQVFRLITGKDSMDCNDFKILAAIGAWGGWQILPFTIFTSIFLVFFVGTAMMKIQREKDSIPYGSWLVLAGLIGLIFRDDIVTGMIIYFQLGSVPVLPSISI